jgi:acyl-CoA reductase-like NAD-dependent aldehyde dehydrogenase
VGKVILESEMIRDRPERALDWNVQPLINGKYRPSSSVDSIDDINPADETSLCRIPVGSEMDVDEAVRISRLRFDQGCWSGISPATRSEVLLRWADLIVENKRELALLDTLEMGKPIQSSRQDAAAVAPALLRTFANFATQLLGSSAPLRTGVLSFNTFEPRGVVAAITPWNFPLVNAVIKCGAALAAGNSVVLKPSELSPSSALRLAELALEAGLPEGVLNVVPGLGATAGTALGLHPDVDLLSFTGSTSIGRKILELSGRSNGKPVMLECGGKSPHVVFDDASDLGAVAVAAAQGILANQGQVCSAHTRLIVHKDIKDELLERVIDCVRQHEPGDPLDETTTFGPLASPAQRDRVRRYIDQGLAAGARAVLRGTVQTENGCYVSPTIFDGVDMHMAIAREEIFGPVLCVQSFSNEAEAIALANGTDYGLVATVWTRDLGRSRRLSRAIRAGIVIVRASGDEAQDSGCTLGFEPMKASGFGVEFGLRGLESYSTLKSVSFT